MATTKDPAAPFIRSGVPRPAYQVEGGRRVGHDLWSYTGRPLTSAMIVGPVQCERAERKRARRAFVLPD